MFDLKKTAGFSHMLLHELCWDRLFCLQSVRKNQPHADSSWERKEYSSSHLKNFYSSLILQQI